MGRKRLFSQCFLLFILTVKAGLSQCGPHKIAKDFKPNLAPYKYDRYVYNAITFGDKPQTIEVSFTAFAGMKYKLVFGTSMFDEDVKVTIYDKSRQAKKRTKLFNNDNGIDNLFWSVEVGDPGIYYVDYDIPAKGDAKSNDGCMVLLLGYHEN